MSADGPEAGGPVEGDDGLGPDRMPGKNGGWLKRGDGGDPERARAASSAGAIKRAARHHIAKGVEYAGRLVERMNTAPGAQLTPAEAKAGLEALALLSRIGEPTTAEDRRDDPSAPDAPAIVVLTDRNDERTATPKPIPGRRGPPTDPNLVPDGESPRSGERVPSRRVGGMGPMEAFGVVRRGPRHGE